MSPEFEASFQWITCQLNGKSWTHEACGLNGGSAQFALSFTDVVKQSSKSDLPLTCAVGHDDGSNPVQLPHVTLVAIPVSAHLS
jgi:hypothetical protein